MRGVRALRFAAILLVVAPLVFSLAGPPTDAAAQSSGGNGRKVIIDNDDKDAIAEATSSGGVLLVEYDTFSLWRIPGPRVSALQRGKGVVVRDEFDTIGLRGGGKIDARAPSPAVPNALRQSRTKERQLWLVQFVGPPKEAWLDDLKKMGLEIVMYMAQNAYVVWGDGAAIEGLDAAALKSPVVQYSGPYHPAYRLAPQLQDASTSRAAGEPVSVTVQFYTTKDVQQSVARLRALGGTVHREVSHVLTMTNISLDLPSAALVAVASWPDVFNVEPWTAPKKHDEAQGQIVAGNITTSGGNVVPIEGTGLYLAWLASKGFSTTPASYPIIDVVDDGIDDGTVTPRHPDFYELGSKSNPDRLIYNQNCTANPAANGAGGHGNLNAAIVGAYNNLTGSPHQDTRNFRLDLGISPYGRLAGTKIYTDFGFESNTRCGGTDGGIILASYNAGATITSNSWGTANNGDYNAITQTYDAMTRDAAPAVPGAQQMLHIFSAGNEGPGVGTATTPGSAKNVLAVGATENVRDDGLVDGCNHAAANNANDMASFSSRGPTTDGRVKPDIVAPGTHVVAAASQDPDFNGLGVCGPYSPEGQTLYVMSTGTSHAAPAVAGGASLLYNYYGRVLAPGQTPSPAMQKALLLNSTRYIDGAGAGGNLPTNAQGWGSINLGTLFDGTPRYIQDELTQLRGAGQQATYNGSITTGSKPFRVTIAWTDPAGPTTGTAAVNNLDLQVTVGGATYKGNVFAGASSATEGNPDLYNNVEGVYLPAGVTGTFSIKVVATSLGGDGIPGNGTALDQDFAIVIYNGSVAASTPVLSHTFTTIAEIAGNGNARVDPGETVSLEFTERNDGSATATGISGSLSVVSGNASVTLGNATYPNIAVNAPAKNTPPYRVSVTPNHQCGTPVVLRHQLTFNSGLSTTQTYALQTGNPVPGSTSVYTSTNVPRPILEYPGAGVLIDLPISNVAGVITDINARVSLTHNVVSDLQIQLISPAGTTIQLFDRRGGSGAHLVNTIFADQAATPIASGTAPFSGAYRPEAPLTQVYGQSVNGTWQLRVTDRAANNTGTVTQFALGIQSSNYQCSSVPTPSDLTITKSHPGGFTVGQVGTYALTVANVGAAAASSPIAVTDTLPTGLTYQSGGGNGWTCEPSGQTISCSYAGALASGASTSFPINVMPQPPGAAQVTNSATVAVLNEVNIANNTATHTAAICALPRPQARLNVTRLGAGQIQVVVQPGQGNIASVDFPFSPAAEASNASVSVASAGIANRTTAFSVPVNAASLTFTVRRNNPGAFTTPVIVTDGCGAWKSFVGAGS